MDRVRGRRFDDDQKLNKKKVFATVVAIVVFIMVIISITKIFKKDNKIAEMIVQTAYFLAYDNEKYGVIDNKGNIIINPSYDEMIIIPNDQKPLFICAYDAEHTKVLDGSGNEILTNFSKVQAIENNDEKNIWYEDNILKYEKDGLYGLIDFGGKTILKPEYNNIYALEGISKSIIVEKDEKKGIVNSSLGELVLECKYDDITSLSTNTADDGYIVKIGEKFGLVTATGKNILECNYQEIKHVTGNDMYVVNDGASLKIIDKSVNVIKDGGFDDIVSIDGENIIIRQNDTYGVVNTKGEEKIPSKYEDLKFASDNHYIAKQNGLYGVISIDDAVCIDFKYKSIAYLETTNFYQTENADNITSDIIDRKLETKLANIIVSEPIEEVGYIKVRDNKEYKYYNLNFEEKSNIDILTSNTLFLTKKDGKYVYVNKKGDLVNTYQYDDAKEQNQYGYCAVNKDGVWGCLGPDGKEVLKPSVKFDNEDKYIDFIAGWHLYNDSDLKMYVK